MTKTLPRFGRDELGELPPPGFYLSTISAPTFRTSAQGNLMLRIVHALDDVSPPWDRVTDFFVFDTPNARANAMARRRLVLLYRACDLDPRPDQPISPADIDRARLQVRLEHHRWEQDAETRLRVAGYRRTPDALP